MTVSINAASDPVSATLLALAASVSLSVVASATCAFTLAAIDVKITAAEAAASGGGGIVVPANRIAQITTTYGGRPAEVPDSYWRNAAIDAGDPNTMPPMPPMTHMVMGGGQTFPNGSLKWSDGANWMGGVCPNYDSSVVNPVVDYGGFDVTYDIAATDPASYKTFKYIGTMSTGSLFRMQPNVSARRLCVNTLMMYRRHFGDKDNRCTYELVYVPIQGFDPGATTNLGSMTMGGGTGYGVEAYNNLLSMIDLPAGSTSFSHPSLPLTNWPVGAKVCFPGTEFAGTTNTDPTNTNPDTFWKVPAGGTGNSSTVSKTAGYFQTQAEVRTITGYTDNGTTMHWRTDRPLLHDHKAYIRTLKRGEIMMIPISCEYLSYSRVHRTAGSRPGDAARWPYADITNLQKRGHDMDMFEAVDDRFVSYESLGRSSISPRMVVAGFPGACLSAQGGNDLANPNDVRGRYVKHAHGMYIGWGRPMFIYKNIAGYGQLPEDDGPLTMDLMPIPGWALVNHNSNGATEKTFMLNVRGGAWVAELGNESGQCSEVNAAWVRGSGYPVADFDGIEEQCAGLNGHQGVAMDFQARQIAARDCRASDCHYLWNYYQQAPNFIAGQEARTANWQLRSPDEYSLREVHPLARGACGVASGPRLDAYGHRQAGIPLFHNMVGHSCGVAFYVAHRNGTDRRDMSPNVIEQMHTINFRDAAFQIRNYAFQYLLGNSVLIGLGSASTYSALSLGNVAWANSSYNNYVEKVNQYLSNGSGFNAAGAHCDIKLGPDVNLFGNDFTSTLHVQDANNDRTFAFSEMKTAFLNGPSIDLGNGTAIVAQAVNIDTATGGSVPWPYPAKSVGGYGSDEPIPGKAAPYFYIDTTRSVLSWENFALFGWWRDELGSIPYPNHYSSESWNANFNPPGIEPYDLSVTNITLEEAMHRDGCYTDNSVLMQRQWWPAASRKTGKRYWFPIDITLPTTTPQAWIDKYTQPRDAQQPVGPDEVLPLMETEPRAFTLDLSTPDFLGFPTDVVVDASEPFSIELLAASTYYRAVLGTGGQEAQFQTAVVGGLSQLQVAGNGSFAFDSSTPANNTKTVHLRAKNGAGNLGPWHTITVHVAELIFKDNFDRANGPIGAPWSTSGPEWQVLNKFLLTNNGGYCAYVLPTPRAGIDLFCDVQEGVGSAQYLRTMLSDGGFIDLYIDNGGLSFLYTDANHQESRYLNGVTIPANSSLSFRMTKAAGRLKLAMNGTQLCDVASPAAAINVAQVAIIEPGTGNPYLRSYKKFVLRGA